MTEQEASKAARLVMAAREILEYVNDPAERPASMQNLHMIYREPESPLQRALREARDLEQRSSRVRALQACLAEWDVPR
jgi:hypothetical protein